jgi:hypothetical protein
MAPNLRSTLRAATSSVPDGMSRPAPARARPAARVPVRLRTLLGLGLLAAAGAWSWPRAEAAWRLHATATAIADYALCMVGPTGPALLRDNPTQFRALVRRRLLGAAPEARLFGACARAAGEVTGSGDVEHAHRASAWSFVEYGGDAADRAAAGNRELRLDDLEVSTRPLAGLAARAWPLVRGGYTTLIRPSVNAKEAVHPVDLARPAVGSGLPAWRSHYRSVWRDGARHLLALGHGANLAVFASSDGGVSWKPSSAREPGVAEHAERCVAGDGGRSFTFAISDDGRAIVVTSLGPDVEPHGAVLADAALRIVAAGCDATGLVAGLRAEHSRDVSARLCAWHGPCAPLALPALFDDGPLPRFPLDLARLRGTTVVAAVLHDTVRVASSRDDGRTWTPWTIAYDALAHALLPPLDVRVPTRLLSVPRAAHATGEERLLLTGVSARSAQRYPVVASDDFGATWRSP